MSEVTSYEAKTKLSELMRRAEAGERIVITRRGVPVIELCPVAPPKRDLKEVFARMDELRKRTKPLDGLTIQELRDEGRR